MSRDLTLVFEIALVGNEDDGEKVLVLDAEDLLVKSRDFLERVAGCDRVDKQKTFSSAQISIDRCYVRNYSRLFLTPHMHHTQTAHRPHTHRTHTHTQFIRPPVSLLFHPSKSGALEQAPLSLFPNSVLQIQHGK